MNSDAAAHGSQAATTGSATAARSVRAVPRAATLRPAAAAATNGSTTAARPAGAGLGWAGGIFPARQELTEAARQVLSRLASLRATRRARP